MALLVEAQKNYKTGLQVEPDVLISAVRRCQEGKLWRELFYH